MSSGEKDEIVAEVEAAKAAPSILPEDLTRITARFAVRVLDLIDFHHMDEELAQDRLSPRFVGPVKRSVAMSSPELFPDRLKPLASSLKTCLTDFEAALVRSDLDAAKALSHEAHEKYHELQHVLADWLVSAKPQGGGITGGPKVLYTCEMHPEVRLGSPGSCLKCGMRLVKLEEANVTSGHDHSHHDSR